MLTVIIACILLGVASGATCGSAQDQQQCAQRTNCAWEGGCICGSVQELDVVMVVDSSGSINDAAPGNFDLARTFVKDVIDLMSPYTRVAIINFAGGNCLQRCPNNVCGKYTCNCNPNQYWDFSWCLKYKPEYYCYSTNELYCAADRIQVYIEHKFTDQQYNNGWSAVKSKVTTMQYLDGLTYTVVALKHATEMLKVAKTNRPDALRKIYLLTDGAPYSGYFAVNPCDPNNAVGWSTSELTTNDIDLTLVELGGFTPDDIQCLVSKDQAGQPTNIIAANFTSVSLGQALDDIEASACPTNEDVAVTEVKPEPALAGVPVTDAQSRFIELWNRGSDIDFDNEQIQLVGLFEGVITSVMVKAANGNSPVWRANTYLVVSQSTMPSKPWCDNCLCTFANLVGQNTGRQCTNAIYLEVVIDGNNWKHNPSAGSDPMAGWKQEAHILSTGKVMDAVEHQLSWGTANTGFSYQRTTESYNARVSDANKNSHWRSSCLAYGTPGDQPHHSVCTGTYPSAPPSKKPTVSPSITPTSGPTIGPSKKPTQYPSTTPSQHPSSGPTPKPTGHPFELTQKPSGEPTTKPTGHPTTPKPTKDPTTHPTRKPTDNPTTGPTTKPTTEPSLSPTISPTTSCSTCSTAQASIPCTESAHFYRTVGSDKVFCCGNNYYVRIPNGQDSGFCKQIPALGPPQSCIINIQSDAASLNTSEVTTTSDVGEKGTGIWEYPLGWNGNTDVKFSTYEGATGTVGNFDHGAATGGLLTTRESKLPQFTRKTFYVEAQYLHADSGELLKSARKQCDYITAAPAAAPVPPPTQTYPKIVCSYARVVPGTTDILEVKWDENDDGRITNFVLFFGGTPQSSLLGSGARTATRTYSGFDYATSTVHIGALIDYSTDTSNPSIEKTLCARGSRLPTGTPTKDPSSTPTRRPTGTPSTPPTSNPTYQGPEITCECVRVGMMQHNVVFVLNTFGSVYSLEHTFGGGSVQTITSGQFDIVTTNGNYNNPTSCKLILKTPVYYGGPLTATTPPWTTCTITTTAPMPSPTESPTAKPTSDPTTTPSSSTPTSSPTMRPTCRIDVAQCDVVFDGGSGGTGTVTLTGVSVSGASVQYQISQKVAGDDSYRNKGAPFTGTSSVLQGLSMASDTLFKVTASGPGNSECHGTRGSDCTRTTQDPSQSPTHKPTAMPTAKPTSEKAGVYLHSTAYTATACKNDLRCECANAPGAECSVGTENYGTRSVVEAQVNEENDVEQTFTFYRHPSTNYPHTTTVNYKVYFKQDATELEAELASNAVEKAKISGISNWATKKDIVPANAFSYDGSVDIPPGQSKSAPIRFEFPVEPGNAPEDTEVVYLLIKSVTYDGGKDGFVFYPGVAKIFIVNVIPATAIGVTQQEGQMPSWVWAIIAAAVLLLAVVGFMAYRRYKKSLATKAKAQEIDRELADLDAEDDPMALDANDVSMNPLATGVKGAAYANLGDTFDAARVDARNNVELANVDVDRVNFRSEFGAVKPASPIAEEARASQMMMMGGAAGGYTAAAGGYTTTTTVVRREYAVVDDSSRRGSRLSQ